MLDDFADEAEESETKSSSPLRRDPGSLDLRNAKTSDEMIRKLKGIGMKGVANRL